MKKLALILLAVLAPLAVVAVSAPAHATDKLFAYATFVTDGGTWTTTVCPGPNQVVDVQCVKPDAGAPTWGYLTGRAAGTTTALRPLCLDPRDPNGFRDPSPSSSAYAVMDAGIGTYAIATGPDNCVAFCGINPALDGTNNLVNCNVFMNQTTSSSKRIAP